MTHVLYVRRSSDREDHQVLSIEQQLYVLRALAEKRGLEETEEIIENASAKEPGRPVFNALMKRIRTGKIDGVLVWRPDRLSRNMVDSGDIIYELSKGHLKEIVTPETTYTTSSDSKFMLVMLFGAAAKYTDDLADAVKRGNQDVLRSGKIPGPVPLGYMKTHEHELTPGSGTAIPDPERFETVKRIWLEVLGGNTNLSSVWRKARNEWGLTTRPTKGALARPIALPSIYNLLRNPFYTGKIMRSGTLYKGEHAPMVTWTQFEQVQQLLEGKKIDTGPKAPIEFLYRGLVHCGRCNALFTGERHKKNGHEYIYYRCSRRHPGRLWCKAPAIREADLELELAAALDTITIDPTIQEWAFEAVAWWAGEGEVPPEKILTRAKSKLRRTEQELTTLTDLIVRGVISEAEYKVRRVNLLGQIEHFREALADPAEKLAAWKLIHDEKRRNGLRLGQDLKQADPSGKQKLLRRTCSRIVVTDRHTTLELRAPYVMRLPHTDSAVLNGPEFATSTPPASRQP